MNNRFKDYENDENNNVPEDMTLIQDVAKAKAAYSLLAERMIEQGASVEAASDMAFKIVQEAFDLTREIRVRAKQTYENFSFVSNN